MHDYPDFSKLPTALGPNIKVDGRFYPYFGGTAYLGIPQHKMFISLYQEGIGLYGLTNGTSRSNNVQLGIYEEVEAYAARKFGAAAALMVSSGFLAAQLAVKQFAKFGQVRHAPETHPALWLDEPPTSKGSFEQWAKAIVEEINESSVKQWLLISNSMNNLFPEIYDFSFLSEISKDKQVILLVDDSHGIGINNGGLGALSTIQAPQQVKVLVVASMGKALGIDAGIIMGDDKLVGKIKNSNAFFGASPPAAAGLHAFMKGEKYYAQERNRLGMLTERLGKALQHDPNWHFIPEFPVFLSKNADLSKSLLEKQILISAFPYPDKDGDLVNRIVLSSWHSMEDIDTLIRALTK
ncbi:MAG: aminotransferase class I/II-fold pyridoxal phosphate-dependent enzyme [Pedobacter sp.]|nr:aminotransferase class I/II-fold pyridoxal phosphate-dependent enzyme [Pedobacter sp.]MDQ8052510.1 aminotransferase class I/II-fold pyridoxal phosphate-dependent enzyme [Pedobacter sp.]